MGVRGDERGQSIQIGAIILFGALIILFSTYQAFVVPQQNAEIESDHLATIDQQMQDLRNAIVSIPGTGTDRSVTLTLGTTYPARIVALNPNPPSGTIRTVGTADPALNLTLANARVSDDETGDFWNGTDRSYNTGALAYEPNYNEYENPPTIVYGNTLLTKEFRAGNLSVTGQRLIDGNRLTLITLNGSLDRGSGESVSLDVQAVSASDTSVQVENETGENVTIRVASRRNASAWREVLADDEQFTDQGGHVVRGGVTQSPLPGSFTLVTIELERGVDYRLRMAKAGVGTQVSDEGASYLTDLSGDGASIETGETRELTVQVRDAHNNPVPGVTVSGTAESGTLDVSQRETDGDGTASFEYTASGTTGDVAVNFSYLGTPGTGFAPGDPENVTMLVTVRGSSGGASGTDSAFTVSWASPDSTGDNTGASISCNSGDCTWDVGASSTDDLVLRGQTTPTVQDITLDFGLNDTSIATLTRSSNQTDTNGEATTTLTANANGSVAAYVSAGGSSDRLNISVENVTSGGGSGTDVTSGTASDLSGPGEQTQTFTVSLGDDLSAGEDITIDLSDTDRQGRNEDISYSNPSTSDPGTVSLSGKTLTYSPAGSESSGDTLTITVDATPGGQASGNTYSVTFTGDDGSSATDTFSGG